MTGQALDVAMAVLGRHRASPGARCAFGGGAREQRRRYDGSMTASQQTSPVTLLPVGEDKNLLTVTESAASCCGGCGCSAGD